ncbi:2-succinyl-6-hydroxy-2,4-cyclohexadiene-1-carboxylate synthase [Pasteurellaceae bacterium 15-036681]|nr:2-succinyl-6-hydroxy-2,4-cyclohexadiene-1-carboxylate synthase [Pasteurellaceae bacterium 15-036681]
MLAHQWHSSPNSSAIPVVFLHGLLGSQHDWGGILALLQNIPQIRPLTIDLPFHGESQQISCSNFDHSRQLLDDTLKAIIPNQPFWLVGYSLGGRTALDYSLNANNPNLVGTVLEGTNIGLASETERHARWQNDVAWAHRFRSEQIEMVLTDWYKQAVFADLDENKRLDLIKKRRNNCGQNIAKMLEATSLAKQDCYLKQIQEHNNIHFLIGERDNKFRNMVELYQLRHNLIPNAGHNAHWENPKQFVQCLNQIITQGK